MGHRYCERQRLASFFYQYICSTAADLIVGQEIKQFKGDQADSAEASLRNVKWKGRVNPCARGPNGGASAGTFVGARAHVGIMEADDFEPNDVHPRVQFQKVGAICKGGLHVGSTYLYDRVGPTHPTNVDVLDHTARRLCSLSGPWILGGDFNCEPQELIDTGVVDLVDGVIHAPADDTCGKKVFDFFVVSKCLSPAIFSVNVVADGLLNPHCPVRMLVRAAPRAMLVQRIKAPKGFQAKLPFGPPAYEQTVEAAAANTLFSGNMVDPPLPPSTSLSL